MVVLCAERTLDQSCCMVPSQSPKPFLRKVDFQTGPNVGSAPPSWITCRPGVISRGVRLLAMLWGFGAAGLQDDRCGAGRWVGNQFADVRTGPAGVGFRVGAAHVDVHGVRVRPHQRGWFVLSCCENGGMVASDRGPL